MTTAREILEELVECKDLKERIGSLATSEHPSAPAHLSKLEAEYLHRKPLAWDAARAFLAKPRTVVAYVNHDVFESLRVEGVVLGMCPGPIGNRAEVLITEIL